MIDLAKVKLSSAIMAGGNLYKIKTDFRFWLIFSKLIKDKETILGQFDFLYDGKIPYNRYEGVSALFEFYNPPRLLPRDIGKNEGIIVLDYELDSELIYAAFLERYNVDLFDPELKLHWHKFLALISGLHDTKLNEVMSFRSYNRHDNTSYEQQMDELRRAWELPQNRELSEATRHWNSLFEK